MTELILFDATPDSAIKRRCSSCGEAKPLATAFRKRNGRYRPTCKTCEYRRKAKRRAERDPQHNRNRTLWQFYRLTRADYDEMLRRQEGTCVLCSKPFADDPGRAHVDHDHKCNHPGKGSKCCRACVRGILCMRCNIFVGWIENDHRRIAAVLGYLGVDGVVIWAHVMEDLGYGRLGAVAVEMDRRTAVQQ